MAQLEVGISLPNTIPAVSRSRILDWAVRAEQLGASSIASVDRLAYPSWDPMIALAAAAAVTTTPRLVPSVLVSPLRSNTALFAQETASLDRLSEGRLVLGLGISRRADDYEHSKLDFHQRGRALDRQLEELTAFWAAANNCAAGTVGPAPHAGRKPSVLIGGQVPATLRRVATWGDGWIAAAGLGGWDSAITFAERVREAWGEAGREGNPRLVVTVYSAAGSRAGDRARHYMRQYYGFLGEAKADELAGHVLTSPERVAEAYQELAEAGFDELILLPTSAEIDELAPLEQLGAGAGRSR
ncbi:MAG TPA: LLM class flavin-dependent oxidoreductase [Trebonia sp.]|jgi:alkanesulfonate monooxygenase SsuD/methylene tetrahydromethanopterin reductase-like flavin-dependent oxidoreductase (luciferase family)|nr:LLM class flavin-dependent oxidoreductase [Trebonia sp.]